MTNFVGAMVESGTMAGPGSTDNVARECCDIWESVRLSPDNSVALCDFSRTLMRELLSVFSQYLAAAHKEKGGPRGGGHLANQVLMPFQRFWGNAKFTLSTLPTMLTFSGSLDHHTELLWSSHITMFQPHQTRIPLSWKNFLLFSTA